MPKYKFVGEEPVHVPAYGLFVEPGEVVDIDGVEGQANWEPVKAQDKKGS